VLAKSTVTVTGVPAAAVLPQTFIRFTLTAEVRQTLFVLVTVPITPQAAKRPLTVTPVTDADVDWYLKV